MDPGSPRIRLQIYRAPKLGSPSAWGKMAKVAPPPPSTITIGICAMDKKADGKPMKELLKRLEKKSVEFVRFGDELLMNAPVDEWPECQVLIAFYSDGFPLGKAMEYKKKYPNMLSLNDLSIQVTLNPKPCAIVASLLSPRRGVLERNQQEKHAGKGGDGRQAGTQ